MGGHPWFYFVPYEEDINAALQALREHEFRAGRYNPAEDFPEFPITAESPAPGAQHDSIEEAIEEADADGTRSILDMMAVADSPDFGVVAPLPAEDLIDLFGTDKPMREMIEESDELHDKLERGQGVYIISYKDERPSEIFFAGYSYD
ncbi:MAG TPA: hypothetical protein VJT09_11220 [Pyrinomonadaceae bacterium]|nr:hypothetical protein [Pyrinomonadaceae bacterium]